MASPACQGCHEAPEPAQPFSFPPPPLTQVLGTFYQELAGRSVLTSALVHLFTFGMHIEEAELC